MRYKALLVGLAIAHLVFPSGALAAPAQWTEEDAVASFLAESPRLEATRRRLAVAQAETVGAGAWENPALSLDREQVMTAGTSADQNRIGVEWALPLTGKQGVRQAIAQTGLTAAQARVDQETFLQVVEFREAFAAASHADAQAEALRESLGVYQRVERIVFARTRTGESAGYDLMRVSLAKGTLEARLSHAQASAREERARLSGLMGKPVEGALRMADPLVPPPPSETLLARASKRKDFASLKAGQEQARLSERLAWRQAWADPSVSLGVIQASEPTVQGVGYLAGVSWPLPIFSRGQGELARAEAEANRLSSEESALRLRLDTEIPPAREALASRIAATRTFLRDVVSRLPELLRTAEVSYQEGEGSIVSLLDAHQAAVETRLQSLSHLLETQNALLALERLVGAPITPLKRN